MININNNQHQLIVDYNKKKFIEQAITVFRALYSRQTSGMSDIELTQKINNIIDRAISFNLTREDHISIFAGLCFVWGDELDSLSNYPWARKILKWNSSADVRVQALISKFNCLKENEKNII